MDIAKLLLGVIALVSFLSCSDSGLKQYEGDGNIRKLSGSMLGVAGYSVIMPAFDLSKGLNQEYSLKGLPVARAPYNIYLVVADSEMGDDVLSGSMKITFTIDNKTHSFAASIKKMTNNAVGSENRSYFYDIFSLELLKPHAPMSDIKLSIYCKNDSLTRPVKAYILVRSGGYK